MLNGLCAVFGYLVLSHYSDFIILIQDLIHKQLDDDPQLEFHCSLLSDTTEFYIRSRLIKKHA